MSVPNRHSRVAALAALGLALAALPGCRVGRAGGKMFAQLFSSPRKVEKTRQPVRPDARLAAIWVGHATMLVQIDDKVILTDPVFTASVGQISQRVVEPGLDPQDLPPIDAVLVSHLHYDHFSLGSLELIEPKVRRLVLPPGGTAYLTGWFAFPASELRPWQAWEKDGLRVTAVPVDHVSFRYGLEDESMTTSFTGYVVEYHGLKVYFGGDTAYDQRLFVETGQRYPKIDLALLPIAPIEPRELMRKTHMDPREALQAFVDLGAARMIPIHYDTFVNSTDRGGDALRVLATAQKRWNLEKREVIPLPIGQRRVFIPAEPAKPENVGKPATKAEEEGPKETPPPAPTPAPTTTTQPEEKNPFD